MVFKFEYILDFNFENGESTLGRKGKGNVHSSPLKNPRCMGHEWALQLLREWFDRHFFKMKYTQNRISYRNSTFFRHFFTRSEMKRGKGAGLFKGEKFQIFPLQINQTSHFQKFEKNSRTNILQRFAVKSAVSPSFEKFQKTENFISVFLNFFLKNLFRKKFFLAENFRNSPTPVYADLN